MELIQKLGERPYFDSNILIYCLEGYAAHQKLFDSILSLLDSNTIKAVTSILSLGEILVMPKRKKLHELEMQYYEFLFGHKGMNVIPINYRLLDQAADLRVSYDLRLPDAIHLSSAIQAQCSSFFTHDNDFKKISGIPCLSLKDLAASL